MGVVLAVPHEMATLGNSCVFVQVFKDSHAQFVIISFYIIYMSHEQTNRFRCIHGANGAINQGL
jgi:hypothetical protein